MLNTYTLDTRVVLAGLNHLHQELQDESKNIGTGLCYSLSCIAGKLLSLFTKHWDEKSEPSTESLNFSWDSVQDFQNIFLQTCSVLAQSCDAQFIDNLSKWTNEVSSFRDSHHKDTNWESIAQSLEIINDIFAFCTTSLIEYQLEVLQKWLLCTQGAVNWTLAQECTNDTLEILKTCWDSCEIIKQQVQALNDNVAHFVPDLSINIKFDFHELPQVLCETEELQRQLMCTGKLDQTEKTSENMLKAQTTESIMLLPLSKTLISHIIKGNLWIISDLFSSGDKSLQHFTSQLLATFVLPWDATSPQRLPRAGQHERHNTQESSTSAASEGDTAMNVMLPNELCIPMTEHLLELVGTKKRKVIESLKTDTLRTIGRLLSNERITQALLESHTDERKGQNSTSPLNNLVGMLTEEGPVKLLALRILMSIAHVERFRHPLFDTVGVEPFARVFKSGFVHTGATTTTEEEKQTSKGSGTLSSSGGSEDIEDENMKERKTESEVESACVAVAAQILADFCSEEECLLAVKKQHVLPALIEFARHGEIVVFRRIQPEDLDVSAAVGRGVYATVHRGVWKGREVAVKVFDEGSLEFRFEDFLQEISLLSICRHPNLLHMYGAVVCASQSARSQFMIVSELLSVSVKQLLRENGPLGTAQALDFGTQVARGMRYLHALGMIHRDLKCANLLIDRHTQTVRICDFGLSRFVNNTVMTACAGTPKWEAPECLDSTVYTTAADVYSFGMTLWEMATAEEPFPAVSNIFELKKLVCDKKKRPTLPAGLHPLLRELIRACWSATPKKRPTFAQIVQQLDNFAALTAAQQQQQRQ